MARDKATHHQSRPKHSRSCRCHHSRQEVRSYKGEDEDTVSFDTGGSIADELVQDAGPADIPWSESAIDPDGRFKHQCRVTYGGSYQWRMFGTNSGVDAEYLSSAPDPNIVNHPGPAYSSALYVAQPEVQAILRSHGPLNDDANLPVDYESGDNTSEECERGKPYRDVGVLTRVKRSKSHPEGKGQKMFFYRSKFWRPLWVKSPPRRLDRATRGPRWRWPADHGCDGYNPYDRVNE
ncbi:hypothetical protein SAMD00023353_0601800 [Rosellinia necatrix]|uniref:Uncharacterized protein n=1 Tax=Rosellinia necatrix TaxID=77044 RepID=A0A1S7UL65_ROSNE|nr:hypothetical protein SAMD00023353_0601800 [Rosellinia necatrix]